MVLPQDLTNPIPGRQALTLGQMFSPPARQASQTLGSFLSPMAPASQPSPQPSPQPSGDTLDALGPDPGADHIEEMLSLLGPDPGVGADGVVTPAIAGEDPNADQFVDNGRGASLMERFKSGLGITQAERMSTLKTTFGEKNVKEDPNTGQIGFRKEGEKKFTYVSPGQLGIFSKLLGGIADNSGIAVQAATAIPFEVAGSAAGLAAGGVGLPLGLAAGAFAGGVAGETQRQTLLQSAGGRLDPEVDTGSEALASGAANVAGLGVGAALSRGAAYGLGVIREAFKDFPLNRIRAVAKLQSGLEEFANDHKIDGVIPTAGEAGARIEGASARERKILNGKIAMLKDTIIQADPDRLFPMSNTMQEMRNVLIEQGVKFDESGMAVVSGRLQDVELQVLNPRERVSSIVDESGAPLTSTALERGTITIPGEEVKPPIAPFGAAGGESVIQKIAKHYNDIFKENAAGGLKPDEVFRYTQLMQDFGDYAHIGPNLNPGLASKLNRSFRKVGEAASSDRDIMAATALQGRPEQEMFTRAYTEYTTRIDPLRGLEKIIDQKESNEMLTKAIILPNNSERIRKFKQIVGDDKEWNSITGPVWKSVKGQWIQNLIESSSSPSTGIIDGNALLTGMQKLGKETLDEVLSKEEQGGIRKIALMMNKIKTSDLIRPEERTAELGKLPFFSQLLPTTKANILWRLFKSDAKAADYMLEEGFMKQYRDAAPLLRREILETMTEFERLRAGARLVSKKNKFWYIDKPNAVMSTIRNTGAQTLQDKTVPRRLDEVVGMPDDTAPALGDQ